MTRALSAWLSLRTAQREKYAEQPPHIEEQVSALFAELRTPLLRYLFTLGLPIADGEDIAQETFLALYHHLRQGKPQDNLHGWVFRVAHNLALKARTRMARGTALADAGMIADSAPNPEDCLRNSRAHQRVDAVLRALPERDRCCLQLRAEGLRYREIAETLEMSLGAVALAIGRSLDRLGSVAREER